MRNLFRGWTSGLHLAVCACPIVPFRGDFGLLAKAARDQWSLHLASFVEVSMSSSLVGVPLLAAGGWTNRSRPPARNPCDRRDVAEIRPLCSLLSRISWPPDGILSTACETRVDERVEKASISSSASTNICSRSTLAACSSF